MSFRSPALLLLTVALVPAVWALLAYAVRRRRQALALFLGPRAETEAGAAARAARRRKTRGALVVAAVACLGVALAGPRAGVTTREARQESLDLLVVLDVSESMRAEDVAPSRLDRAKLEIERIVDARRGDRVGLVVFAGEAFLQCPLTTDRSALRLFLDAADPEQISIQGTDVARALGVARRAFEAGAQGAQQARPRAVLVVSDGETHEGDVGSAAADLRKIGTTLLAIGIGTEEGGTIPDVQRGNARGVKRDRSGNEVVSRYEPGALDALADRGDVFRVGRRGTAAPAVNAALDRLDRAVVSEDRVSAGAERYQWPLALGFLLLLAERAVALRPTPESEPEPEPA